MHQEQTLKRLVKEAADDSEEAFRSLFEQINDRVFAYARSHTKRRDDALDIVQETFIELWGALSQFEYRSDEAFYGFVFIILKRKLSRHHRKHRVTVSLEDIADVETYDMDHEDYRYLIKHVEKLAKKYRELLRLRYWAGLSFREIAATLQISESTAKVQHHRAIKKLRINLEKYNNAV